MENSLIPGKRNIKIFRISKLPKVAKKKKIIATTENPQHNRANLRVSSCRLSAKNTTAKRNINIITALGVWGRIISLINSVKSVKVLAAKNAADKERAENIITFIILIRVVCCSLARKSAKGLRINTANVPIIAATINPKNVYSSALFAGIIITEFPSTNKAVAAAELL